MCSLAKDFQFRLRFKAVKYTPSSKDLLTEMIEISLRIKSNNTAEPASTENNEVRTFLWNHRRGNLVCESLQCKSGPKACWERKVDTIQGFGLIPGNKGRLLFYNCRDRSWTLIKSSEFWANKFWSCFLFQSPQTGDLRNAREGSFRNGSTRSCSTGLWITSTISFSCPLRRAGGFLLLLPIFQSFKPFNEITKLTGGKGEAHSRYCASLFLGAAGAGNRKWQRGTRKIQRASKSPETTKPMENPKQSPKTNQAMQEGWQWKGQEAKRENSLAKASHFQTLSANSTCICLERQGTCISPSNLEVHIYIYIYMWARH